MDGSKNHHLGINRISKNIRKVPLHQPPNFPATHPPPPPQAAPPQPQVYNISKNDFRSIVQQLTGTPTRDPANPNPSPLLPPPSRPPHPKPPSMRLQKIRPPPLTPIARPPPPIAQPPAPAASSRPAWAESPVTAYMRYLESSLFRSDYPRQPSPMIPPPPGMGFPSPRGNPPPLPSPGSQFPLSSPSGFLNLLSPRSPYPLLSPGFQHPLPFTPNFSFSPMNSQAGILGPGPQTPLSPGVIFPQSPSGYLPLLSPRWRDM